MIGYYCPTVASTTPRHTPCGNATVYCPRGSYTPSRVYEGFYCDTSGFSQGALDLASDKGKTVCRMLHSLI